MDKDHPNAEVRAVKEEINPEGASFDLLFGVRRALVVIVVFHRWDMEGWRGYRLGIADEGSCLEELDDELFFFDFTALRFSHSSSLRGRSPAFSRSVLFLW